MHRRGTRRRRGDDRRRRRQGGAKLPKPRTLPHFCHRENAAHVIASMRSAPLAAMQCLFLSSFYNTIRAFDFVLVCEKSASGGACVMRRYELAQWSAGEEGQSLWQRLPIATSTRKLSSIHPLLRSNSFCFDVQISKGKRSAISRGISKSVRAKTPLPRLFRLVESLPTSSFLLAPLRCVDRPSSGHSCCQADWPKSTIKTSFLPSFQESKAMKTKNRKGCCINYRPIVQSAV